MRPDINFTPKMTPNGRPCTPSKYFNHAGTRWGANNFGKSGGGRSNFKILWLDHEIPKFLHDFLSIAIRVKIGFRTLPESSNIFVGVSPPHLAATAGGCRYGGCLVYVVEGHASACPQTVGVDVKYVALTLIKLKREVSASIMRPNKNVDLLFHCYLVLVNTIYYFIQFGGIRTHF